MYSSLLVSIICFIASLIFILGITALAFFIYFNIQYSDKQHRGNTGEGQFHLKNSNIQYHINKYLYTKIDYNKLWKLLNE